MVWSISLKFDMQIFISIISTNLNTSYEFE